MGTVSRSATQRTALVVAAAGFGFIAFSNLGENLVYYWSPGEMINQGEKAYGATIRLGGVVKPGSIVLSHYFNQPDTISAYEQLLPWLAENFELGTPPVAGPAGPA